MIRFSNVSLRRGAKPLLEGADVSINPGERIGLIGANGSGKTSLFALLRGELHTDKGDVDFPRHWRVAHVAQETPAVDQPALEFAIVLAMALFTTYAAWRLSVRERAAWRMHRRFDVHSLGWIYALCGTVVLWLKLASGDPSHFGVVAAGFAVVLLYLFLPDPRLERDAKSPP